jgi:hypothetical protein
MATPDINPDPSPAREPVRVMAMFDGNYSTNYAMVKNARQIDSIQYGEESCPCCGHHHEDCTDDCPCC